MVDYDEVKWSVQNGDIDKLKTASQAPGFNVNQVVGMGRQLIHCAADYGQKDILTFLLSIGASVNAVDKHGITPLMNAVFEGHKECAKMLLEKGADKSMRAPSGESILECAETNEMKELLQ